jgi:hypothetical protein
MARPSPYFGVHAGPLKIWVGFFEVGSGTFSLLNDTEADFAGAYKAFGQAGNFSLRVRLADPNPAATSDKCEVTLNGKADVGAKYEVHGAQLTVATTLNPTPVAVYCNQNGTQIDGISGHNLWIG